jgi:hypothetical protein
MLKLNWQPFPLIEDFRFYFGGGVSSNVLLKATLSEKATKVFKSSDPYVIPQTTQYQDSKDVTSLGVKNSLFTRFDFGIKYKRIQIALRVSVSIQDMYFKGLEKNWAVPAKESAYISGHTAAGTTNEKYSELAIGYTLF